MTSARNEFEKRIRSGAKNVINNQERRFREAHNSNDPRRVLTATKNYIQSLQSLKNYLYGGRSNVPNVPGYERNHLNNSIHRVKTIGSRVVIAKHKVRLNQSATGTNLKLHAKLMRNYLDNLRSLKNYLYTGQNNARNIRGLERPRLNAYIRRIEDKLTMALYQYILKLRRNVIQTSKNIYAEHMKNAQPYGNNTNLPLSVKRAEIKRNSNAHYKSLYYIQGQVLNEPLLAQTPAINRSISVIKNKIEELRVKMATLDAAMKHVESRKRKYPGSHY